MGRRPLLITPLLVIGCSGYFDGDVKIERVEPRFGLEDGELEIELANKGRSAVWAWKWPHKFRFDPEERELIVSFHRDEPGDHLEAFTPLVSFERLRSAENPLGGNDDVFTISLPSTFAAIEADGESTHVPIYELEAIFVELAWHDDNPGKPPLPQAPTPSAVAIGEWIAD